MGVYQDHFMFVSSADYHIGAFREKAVLIFRKYEMESLVSPVIPSIINGNGAFFIAPDGGKEGWSTSDLGNAARKEFRRILEDTNGPWVDWLEIATGELGTKFVGGSQ